MNFCDKLQKIRKENNITQEQLADKLNVSRQAVSKWESGTAYPDTEKLIQISKLFKVSLDELINDNVDMNKNASKKKFNFMETFDIVFESVRKTFSMFFAMKFWEKIKFLFEMAFVVLAIFLAANLIDEIILSIIRRIFAFLPYQVYNVIDYIFYTLLYILWVIIGIMFFIRVLKVRYLDYYMIIKDDSVDRPQVEEPIKELKENRDTKIVIRDPKDSSTSFFKVIAKVIMFIFKCICIFVLVPFVIAFVMFASLLVMSLFYLFSGLFFNGITLGVLGILTFIFLIIRFLYNVIFNQKINYGKLFIIFIISLLLIGIGVGVSFTSLNSFTTYSENIWEKKTTTLNIPMSDNLVVEDIANISDDKIVIDNELDDIKLDIITSEFNIPYCNIYNRYGRDDERMIKMANIYIDDDEFAVIKQMANDLKNKKINTYNLYNNDYEIDKVYISLDNLTKLKENYKKLED